MAIPDFLGQQQQALQSGLRLGGALQNAETLRMQREQAERDAQFQSQLRPLQVQQAELGVDSAQMQNQAMQQEDRMKGLAQDAIMLSALDEETGKELIKNELINKYQGDEPVLASLRELYQKSGKEYIADTLQAVAAFTGKPIDSLAERKVKVQEENSRLRALEISEKNLDRQLKRETNELKRQELEQKIADRRKEKDQVKTERNIEGQNAISDIDLSLSVVDELIKSPGLEAAVGLSSLAPTLPGGEAADFESKLEQLKSQQFLNNIQKMKGLGALSEAEGRKVASAAAALDLSMSEKRFKKELQTVFDNLNEAKKRIEKKYEITPPKEETQDTNIVDWNSL